MEGKLPWIFGIGSPKSGSNSLADALKIMGFNAKHTFQDLFDGNNSVLKLLESYKEGDLPSELAGVDALVDWPMQRMWPALMRRYPEAKFILTYRTPDEVALSWCRQMLAQPEVAKSQPIKEYSRFKRDVEEHVNRVLKAFLNEGDRLLILNASDSDSTKWKLLSVFLGMEVDHGRPYPRSFDHAKWQSSKEELDQMKGCNPER